MTPVTRTLLFACLGGFVLQQFADEWLLEHLALWPLDTSPYPPLFRPWQLLTHALLHGDWLHLALNGYALFLFGSEIERLMGSRRFALYFAACVLGAALSQVAWSALANPGAIPTVGASGGIFGLLLAFGWAYPRRKIMPLLPPIPMPAWVFVSLYAAVELWFGFTGTMAGVAHFAHLGGMLAGVVLLLAWRLRPLE
jgi:membrane associated rhomboid family serine protease